MRAWTIISLLPVVCGVVNVDDIHKYLEDAFQCSGNKFKGFSVSIVNDDKLLYSNGFGVKDSVSDTQVTNKTLFGIGGLTKSFAAALVAQQFKNSTEFSLDSTLKKVLNVGMNHLFDSSMRRRFATTRDLLAHNMGYCQHGFIRLDDSLTRADIVRRMKTLKVKSRFRDSYRYNNLFYGYVTHLSEELGKKSWEDLIKENLYAPLGMTDSTFLTTANLDILDLAKGYLDDYGTLYEVPSQFLKNWAKLCGANCILSSADDMANWMIFHLTNGKNPKGVRVMSSKVVKELHKPWNRIQNGEIEDYFKKRKTPYSITHDTYGLGWKQGVYRGWPILTHSGSTYGYDSLITMIKNQGIGVYTAVSGNDHNNLFMTNIHNYIIDTLNGESVWVNASTTCSFAAENTPVKTKPNFPRNNFLSSDQIAGYAGEYTNTSYGSVKISGNTAGNGLQMTYGYASFDLFSQDPANAVTPTHKFKMVSRGITDKIIDDGDLQFVDLDVSNPGFEQLTVIAFEDNQPPNFMKV